MDQQPCSVRNMISLFESKCNDAQRTEQPKKVQRSKSLANIMPQKSTHTLSDIEREVTKLEIALNAYQQYDKNTHLAFQKRCLDLILITANLDRTDEATTTKIKKLLNKSIELNSILNNVLPQIDAIETSHKSSVWYEPQWNTATIQKVSVEENKSQRNRPLLVRQKTKAPRLSDSDKKELYPSLQNASSKSNDQNLNGKVDEPDGPFSGVWNLVKWFQKNDIVNKNDSFDPPKSEVRKNSQGKCQTSAQTQQEEKSVTISMRLINSEKSNDIQIKSPEDTKNWTPLPLSSSGHQKKNHVIPENEIPKKDTVSKLKNMFETPQNEGLNSLVGSSILEKYFRGTSYTRTNNLHQQSYQPSTGVVVHSAEVNRRAKSMDRLNDNSLKYIDYNSYVNKSLNNIELETSRVEQRIVNDERNFISDESDEEYIDEDLDEVFSSDNDQPDPEVHITKPKLTLTQPEDASSGAEDLDTDSLEDGKCDRGVNEDEKRTEEYDSDSEQSSDAETVEENHELTDIIEEEGNEVNIVVGDNVREDTPIVENNSAHVDVEEQQEVLIGKEQECTQNLRQQENLGEAIDKNNNMKNEKEYKISVNMDSTDEENDKEQLPLVDKQEILQIEEIREVDSKKDRKSVTEESSIEDESTEELEEIATNKVEQVCAPQLREKLKIYEENINSDTESKPRHKNIIYIDNSDEGSSTSEADTAEISDGEQVF